MKKINDLFDHIGNIQTECNKLSNALRAKYTEYEDLLAQLEDLETEDGQALISDMNQIRATIDYLDLVTRGLDTAHGYADNARWSIKNIERHWEA